MPTEIEYKFLVSSDTWKQHIKQSMALKQGYLTQHDHCNSVRIRTSKSQPYSNFKIMNNAQPAVDAFINIKRKVNTHIRHEFEYPTPLDEADEMLSLCIGNIIEKTRYLVDYCGHTWEIDVFFGVNAGLVLAEIELESENEPFEHPDWLGKDVSDDNRYLNSSLVKYPFNQWK